MKIFEERIRALERDVIARQKYKKHTIDITAGQLLELLKEKYPDKFNKPNLNIETNYFVTNETSSGLKTINITNLSICWFTDSTLEEKK